MLASNCLTLSRIFLRNHWWHERRQGFFFQNFNQFSIWRRIQDSKAPVIHLVKHIVMSDRKALSRCIYLLFFINITTVKWHKASIWSFVYSRSLGGFNADFWYVFYMHDSCICCTKYDNSYNITKSCIFKITSKCLIKNAERGGIPFH